MLRAYFAKKEDHSIILKKYENKINLQKNEKEKTNNNKSTVNNAKKEININNKEKEISNLENKNITETKIKKL